MDGYDEVRIQIDRLGQPIGCVVIHDRHRHETIRPVGVGPFDTPADVLDHVIRTYLTVQQTLW